MIEEDLRGLTAAIERLATILEKVECAIPETKPKRRKITDEELCEGAKILGLANKDRRETTVKEVSPEIPEAIEITIVESQPAEAPVEVVPEPTPEPVVTANDIVQICVKLTRHNEPMVKVVKEIVRKYGGEFAHEVDSAKLPALKAELEAL